MNLKTPDTSQAAVQPMGRKAWALAALLALASASVVVSLNAWAAPGPGRHDRGEHPGMMHAGMGVGMPFDAVHIEHLLDEVKATDAQRAQIRQIGDKARADLRALHAQMPGAVASPAGTGGGVGPMALLTQPKVDAAAAEKARQAMLAHHDAVSKRMLQGTLDIANVLTPEQRVALGKAMQDHRAHHADHGEGPGPEGKGRPGQPEARKFEAK